jgi:hypothetical protein
LNKADDFHIVNGSYNIYRDGLYLLLQASTAGLKTVPCG